MIQIPFFSFWNQNYLWVLVCSFCWGLSQTSLAMQTKVEEESSSGILLPLISSALCEKTEKGELTHCRLDPILLEETRNHLPELPYRTLLHFESSLSCQKEGDPAYLTLEAFAPEGSYLFTKNLDFVKKTRSIIETPQRRLLGKMILQPKNERVFFESRYPADCEIHIRIHMNTLYASTQEEADEIQKNLAQELKKMEEQFELWSVLVSFQGEQKAFRKWVETLWEESFGPDSRKSGLPCLDLMRLEQMKPLFDSETQAFLGELVSSLKELQIQTERKDSKSKAEKNRFKKETQKWIEKSTEKLSHFFQAEKLQKTREELEKKKGQYESALLALEPYSSKAYERKKIEEELFSSLEAQINGPGGVLSAIRLRLKRIAEGDAL